MEKVHKEFRIELDIIHIESFPRIEKNQVARSKRIYDRSKEGRTEEGEKENEMRQKTGCDGRGTTIE